MFTNTGRRIVAACASVLVLLSLGVFTASPSQAADPTYAVSGYLGGAPDVAVRFYRSTGDNNGPWELATTTRSATDGSSPDYSASLAPGIYRVTFNEVPEDTGAWREYLPATWANGDDADPSTFTVADEPVGIGFTPMSHRGGTISGALGDQCDGRPSGLTMQAFAADDPDPAHAFSQPAYGKTYSIHTFAGPTKFRVISDNHATFWLGGDSFATATAYDVDPTDSDPGPAVSLMKRLDTSGTGYLSGAAFDNSYLHPAAGIEVRFYRSGPDAEGPWTLEGQTTTASSGYYSKTLPAGIYHITYNEFPDETAASIRFGSAIYGGRDQVGTANACLENGGAVSLEAQAVGQPAGTITGKASDHRGERLYLAKVELFDADDPAGSAAAPVFTTTTDGAGGFSLPSLRGPAKLRVTANAGFNPGMEPTWSGGAADFASATCVHAAAGETSADNNIVTTDTQMKLITPAKVSGKIEYGSVVQADGSYIELDGATKTYQWNRTIHGATTAITGATGYSYKLRDADVGGRVSVTVVTSPPIDYPGVQPITSTSSLSAVVKRKTHVTVAGKAKGGRKFTITATIKVDGVSKPKGKVRLYWGALKLKGHYLYPTGKIKSKYLSFKNGKVSYSVKVSKKGYWEYAAYMPETSTTFERQSSVKFLKVK